MDIKSSTSPKNALKPYGRGFRQKKRSLTSITTSFSNTDVNAKFGFGPPFLFSLPEPIDDPWRLNSELTLRDIGARPVSTHAWRRILERRKVHNFFDSTQEKYKKNIKERTEETSDDEDSKTVCSKQNFNNKSNNDLVRTPNIQHVQQAVDVKVDEYSQEMLKSISECSKNYLENRCAPGDRVPAAKISAEAFGEIINNLMEQFSYKTMLFMVGIVLAIFLSRALIELFKTRFLNNFPPQAPNTHPGMHSMPSQTPMTPMQVHSVSPIQHHMSPSTSVENSMTSQHNNVGVYYVVTPTR
ncbi:2161_t:CDS:2 [Cetraspora pellucida]|uniref:2161_t:CDS:1 n=2 Tax=Cetraspora pellucida TaxID=1433469 RepID=A0A9N9E6F2_9GLOM|nr:2161_t:CDS:2 [Cetraspora pellucida]